ncbi:SRPBCC family protein [Rhizobium sp. RU36D]|uniref:SRPBCC family protein n=1 Tax=Rhizobium sp. RU36D TaxID=1907415 RepID=UPI0009D8DC86|nr:SRPBCC family protein [Rhizobium sp. RU36D]SMC60807.1 Uncharacterized conserved protein YndB, AHSA1/START domain [Rhizobium sp. RU36D]
MTSALDPTTTLSVSRSVKAPPALVFQMFSDARHLDAWWGPDGFTNETHALDFSVGGVWHYTMHGPDGKAWPNWIRYREIDPPSRLLYDHGGELGEPAHFEGLITFEADEDATLVTLTLIFPTAEARNATLKFGAVEGGNQTLAKLDAFVTRQAAGEH